MLLWGLGSHFAVRRDFLRRVSLADRDRLWPDWARLPGECGMLCKVRDGSGAGTCGEADGLILSVDLGFFFSDCEDGSWEVLLSS